MTPRRSTRTTSRTLLAGLALALPRVAVAEPHKLLVLQSEGRADAATRAKIDNAIVKLAATSEPQAARGELTFSDAATAVGCKPDAASCKDDVLGMLAVDEIVIIAVAPKPGGLEIAVQRVGKGGAARSATMLLPTGASPDQLDGIAPLFSDNLRAAPAAPEPPPATSPTTTPQPSEPAPAIPAPTDVSPPRQSAVVTTPTDTEPPDASARDRKLELAGMIGGGSAVTLGLLLWAGASSTQNEINSAPTRTQSDLHHLRDLESRGDAYAMAGNVLVGVGAIVGGLATYLYIRDRRAASAATAQLAPTVLPHGAGLVLRFGGSP
jgi:hypothetical protein